MVQKYIIWLNLEKYTFGVKVSKFLGFYLTEQGIKANPDNYELVDWMSTLTSKKEVQKMNYLLVSLNRFILKFAQHILPFLQAVEERGEVRMESWLWRFIWLIK